jgi:hypothetical protein
MNQALGMTAAVAGIAAGVFSFGYLLLQVPCGHYRMFDTFRRFIAANSRVFNKRSLQNEKV